MDSPDGWVQGDGGPLIVLQKTAAALWPGAANFENSLMNGGTVETDYDVICRCDNDVCLIQRYDRDMLILSDSSSPGRLFSLPPDTVAVVQSFYEDEELPDIMERALQVEPEVSFPMTVVDGFLRLLVGADNGEGRLYNYVEVAVTPGLKRCAVYSFEDGSVVIIKTAAG